MKLLVQKGTTSKSVDIFIRDSSVTTGAGLTGLTYNSGGLTAYYRRPGGSATSITLATLSNAQAAYSSGGFVAVDGTNMPGVYRFDIPNAAIDSGVDEVVIMLKGATNMEPVVIEIQLTNVNVNDGVRAGLTALPNAAAEASGGLYTRGTGAGQISQPANGRVAVDATYIDGVSATALRRAFENMTILTINGTPTNTTCPNSTLTNSNNDKYKGRPLYYLTGNLAGEVVEVTAYNGSTKTLTHTAAPSGLAATAGDIAILA